MKKKIYCSHRGFNSIAPENTLPAFGAAVALGAEEIELDLWPTSDGKIVVCHDPTVDRTTNSTGLIHEMTAQEVEQCDAGIKFSKEFTGLKIPYFEDILKQFANRVIMNLHIKSLNRPFPESQKMQERMKFLGKVYTEGILLPGLIPESKAEILPEIDNAPYTPYDEIVFADILQLIDRYQCRDSVYITGCRDVLETSRKMAPDLKRCCLEGDMNFSIVEHTVEYQCSRVQFCKLFLTQNMIDQAHEHGMICNLFWSDNAGEAELFFSKGIDVILTNRFQLTKRG